MSSPLKKHHIISIILLCSIVLLSGLAWSLSPLNDHIPLAAKGLTCKNCNVILISLDTLGAAHLPCYGYDRDTAPNLCGFAKNNILFSNAYANATWTLPSHVSIFTGLDAQHHHVTHFYSDSLDHNIPFLPEVLQKNNYHTIFLMPSDDPTLPLDLVYNRGIDKMYSTLPSYNIQWKKALDDFVQSTRSGKKTFLFLHTYWVHSPYLTGENNDSFGKDNNFNIPLTTEAFNTVDNNFVTKLLPLLKKDINANEFGSKTEKYQKILSALESASGDLGKQREIINENHNDLLSYFTIINYSDRIDLNNAKEIAYLRSLYDQRIYDMDQYLLPLLFSYLKREEVKKNTIVIITADHGEEFMEHGYIYHSTNYQPNIRVPLIMALPTEGKKTITGNVQSVDIMPTLLDLLGIKNSFRFDGVSLRNELEGLPSSQQLIVNDGNPFTQSRNTKVLLSGKYKLFTINRNSELVPYELYDIQKDPGEHDNILFSKYEIATQLLNQYQKQTTKN